MGSHLPSSTLLGTCLQVYLLLIAYGWVRGLHFRRARVLQFAVRRMGFVLKWALVIVFATLALIHLPLFVEAWVTGDPIGWRTLVLVEIISRPVLAAIMLLAGHRANPVGPSQRLSSRRVRSTWPLLTKAWPKLPCFLARRIVPPFPPADSATGRKCLARCRPLQADLVGRSGNRGSHQRRLDSRVLGLLL